MLKPLTHKSIFLRTFASLFFFCVGLLPFDFFRSAQLFGWLLWIDLMNRVSFRSGLIISLVTGILLSIAGTFWIEYFGSGFIIMAVLLSFWILPGLFCLSRLIQKIPAIPRPAAWFISWLFNGFWVSRTPMFQGFFNFPLILEQILHIGPSWGLLALSLSWIGLAAGLVDSSAMRNSLMTFLCATALVLASFYGITRLAASDRSIGLRAALVQHNMPFYPKSEDLHKFLIDSAAEAAAQKPDLMIFPLFDLPESLQRDLIDERGGFFSDLAKRSNASILIASKVSRLVLNGQFSSRFQILAALRSKNGNLSGVHQSSTRSFFHDKNQDLAPEFTIISSSEAGKTGVLISYELEKAEYAHKAKKLGADYLIGLSNPGDAAYSPLTSYQLREIRRRAIETGLPILTVTPNGYTAWIDSRGRIQSQSRRNQREIIYAVI